MDNNWRQIEAEWQGGGTFIGRNASGGSVQMGKVGEKPGVSPMELVLVAVAGCTGVDIADILVKKRQPLKALKVQVRGKRTDEFPKVYKEIEVTYLIWGDGINPEAVEQAIRLSEDKYCSVSAMLKPNAIITSNYHILTAGETMP
jgi:putative redox protein